MSLPALQNYHSSNFEIVDGSMLGSGNYANVRKLFLKKSKQYVVGKFFLASGSQQTVEKIFKTAEKEAQILAKIKHKNIIQIMGISTVDENQFVIILELAPCGDLERLLHEDNDIPLLWKIRLRFFTELANALDYLHNHDVKKSYIHGDLKPQNILLGHKLEIKVADFGAASIAKITGLTSLTSDTTNTQHTPFYTAPEYLSDPAKDRCSSMDVYSYGMIGYEIITRHVVYSGNSVAYDTLVCLIKTVGQKPDESYLETDALMEANSDLEIYAELVNTVRQCWQFASKDRPKISNVKTKLNGLAMLNEIYDKKTDENAKSLIVKRKLNLEQNESKISATTQKWENVVGVCFVLSLFLTMGGFLAIRPRTIIDPVGFLSVNGTTLSKYNSDLISNVILEFPPEY